MCNLTCGFVVTLPSGSCVLAGGVRTIGVLGKVVVRETFSDVWDTFLYRFEYSWKFRLITRNGIATVIRLANDDIRR